MKTARQFILDNLTHYAEFPVEHYSGMCFWLARLLSNARRDGLIPHTTPATLVYRTIGRSIDYLWAENEYDGVSPAYLEEVDGQTPYRQAWAAMIADLIRTNKLRIRCGHVTITGPRFKVDIDGYLSAVKEKTT